MKQYNIMQNVGPAKYVVNYHDGIAIFRNKKKMSPFVSKLKKDGYIYGKL